MRLKFIIGGILIFAAIAYLVISSTLANAQYFLTVDELLTRSSSLKNREVRIAGVVLGDTIEEDPQNLVIRFTVAHIPGDNAEIELRGGLANVLHQSALDSSLPRVLVEYHGARPDLLKNEAQAIMTGKLDENGIFQAEELLLKCPTRYEEAVPQQSKP